MTFDVELAGPLDLSLSLNGFQRFGDDMIDRWDGTTLVRTATVAGRRVAYTGRSIGTIEQPFLRVTVEDAGAERAVEEEIRSTFLLPPPEWEDLLRDDPVLARLDTRFPGLRPVLQPDLLAALVRSISAQQVNLRWAATTRRRLAERFGERHEVAGWEVYAFDPARLAAAPPEEIRAMQFTTRKAEYIVGAAAAVASGDLSLEQLARCTDAEVIARLTALHGIGRWTAEWILARTLGRPVVVAGDLGVRKAVGAAYLNQTLPTEAEVRSATQHWGTCAAIAQGCVLRALVEGEL